MSEELGRLVRFCAVGATNTILTLACFAVLTRLGAAVPVASALAFGAGAANGYRLNRRWTFATDARGRSVVLRYVAIQGLGAAASAAGAAALTDVLAVARLLAEASILPAVTVMTYLLTRHLFLAR